MTNPESTPTHYTYDTLFNDIDCGRMKLPLFQRDFVWTKQQTADLLDSIIKGYPIGTFILWKTQEEMGSIKEIGNIILPIVPPGDIGEFVLDGQQRITSLYAVRKGIVFAEKGEKECIDYRSISINLDLDPSGDDKVVTIEPPESGAWISVNGLLNGDMDIFYKDYQPYLKKIDLYRTRFKSYRFPVVVMTDYPIDIAVEIFTRINTGGTKLSMFDIMVAKTFDIAKKFNLAERYEQLIADNDEIERNLKDADYETIPAATIIQCVAACISKQIGKREILKIPKDEFIGKWDDVVKSMFSAVDFLRTQVCVPVSQLLPYPALLIPLTYFFERIKYGFNKANPRQTELLIQYFWWASLSQRFGGATESKVEADLRRMDDIGRGIQPSYQGEEIHLTVENLIWRRFSTNDAFCKAILSLYASFYPKSFSDGGRVILNNSWLLSSNSKNYHHFFPKSYLTKHGIPDDKANVILNITMVDDHLNKKVIRDKAPSTYMFEFLEQNNNLLEIIKSHLIEDLDKFGVLDDNYELFLTQRGGRVLEEIKKRLGSTLLE